MNKKEEIMQEIILKDGNQIKKLQGQRIELVEALRNASNVIQRLKLSMLVHPDCVEDSEFDGLTSTAQETEDKIENLLKNIYEKDELILICRKISTQQLDH